MSLNISKRILFVLTVFLVLILIPSSFGEDLNDTMISDANTVDANTIYVSQSGTDSGNGSSTNPFNSISQAVDAYDSSVNSNIYIKNGNYDITQKIELTKDVNIVGESKEGVILNGNNQYSLFEISSKSNVVLTSLSFINGYLDSSSNYYASAIQISNPNSVVIDNCIFKNNQHGAIGMYDYFSTATVTINNTLFDSNKKVLNSAQGAAIYVNGKYTLNVLNSNFENNRADPVSEIWSSAGGAIYLCGNVANAVIDNCKFINNTAKEGSVIYEYCGGDTTITNSEFRDNTATSGNALIYDSQVNSKTLNLNLGNNIIENNNPNTINATGNIKVNYLDNNARLTASDINMVYGQEREFVVTFLDSENNPIGNKNIKITLTDYYNNVTTFNEVTNTQGQVSVSLKNQHPGRYNVLSSFAGDGVYDTCNTTNKVNIQSETDYNMIFEPEYVKMLEGDSVVVKGMIVDSYYEPDNTFDGVHYEIRWLNHKGSITVLSGSYVIEGNEFSYDLSRCHLVSKDDIYYINFTATNTFDNIEVKGSLPVDTSANLPPVNPDIEVIYVSEKGSDETGDGTQSNPLKTMQMALYVNKMLGGGKTVHVMEGKYNLSVYSITENVTVVGEGSKSVLSQDTGRLGMFMVEEGDTLRLINLTFTDGFASPVPGALLTVTDNSNVYIDGCEFYNNFAVRGGVIAISNGNVYVNNSIFHDNKALLSGSRGGAIYLPDGLLRIYNSVFYNNSASDGGAIYIGYEADVKIINTTFKNNTAIATTGINGGGGAIYTESDVGVYIENSTFIENYADIYGGAIYIYGGTLNITKSYFEENSVGYGSSDKANTIQALTGRVIHFNVDYSIFFEYDDYDDIIRIEADENETTATANYNYWSGNSKSFAKTYGVNLTDWVIMQASKDLDPVYKGDVAKITLKFVGSNENGTYDLEKSVHDLTVTMGGQLSNNLNPSNVIIRDNIASSDYYATNDGSELVSFNTTYARHFAYPFIVVDANKEDVNPDITITPGKNTTIDVTLPSDVTGNININVDGNDNIILIKNSHAVLDLYNLNAGNYTVVVTYAGNDKYKGFVEESSFTVNKLPSTLTINVDDVDLGDDAIINIVVTNGATGEVRLILDSDVYTVKLNESKGIYTLEAPSVGTYTVYAIYDGDSNYFNSTASKSFRVNEGIPITTIYVATNGSDTLGNGSQNNPYATISYALERNKRLGGGKTIIVSEGEYVLNAYSISNDVNITADGNVVIYSNTDTYHIYIGGDSDVYLEGLTFLNGKGAGAGSISMGSSDDNSKKKLTIVDCKFIGNTGSVGAITSYADTKILRTLFINNTGTGINGYSQGIISQRDNKLNISYSAFVGNSKMLIFSVVNGVADYNFWGDIEVPGYDEVSEELTIKDWVVISPSVDGDVVLRKNYDLNIDLKATADGESYSDLKDIIPEFDVNLEADYGTITPASVSIVNNTAKVNYVIYSVNDEEIRVISSGKTIATLEFSVDIPEEDKIYVSASGSDSNNASKNSPLKSFKAALAKNKELGGNKTIIFIDGTYSEDALTIDDPVNIITSDDVIISTPLTINADTNIEGLVIDSSTIKHNSGDLTIRDSSLTNVNLDSSSNLIFDECGFDSSNVNANGFSDISNSTFTNGVLTVGDANITSSKFSRNDVVVTGEALIKENEFELADTAILVNSTKPVVIDDNAFNNNSIGIDLANGDAKISNNDFTNDNIAINVNGQASLEKNNIKDCETPINLENGIIENAKIVFIDGKTYKMNSGNVTINATVSDMEGNLINGGKITFIANGKNIGNADVVNGTASMEYVLENGDYTISGNYSASTNPTVTTGTIRVNVTNYWFIGDVGYETLKEAIDAAQNGDVIKGVPGTYIIDEIDVGHRYRSGEPYSIIKNITITTLTDEQITLEGNNSRLFFVDVGSSLTLKNLLIVNGLNEEGRGGAVNAMMDTNLTVINCTFMDNIADSAGAIYTLGGLIVKYSIFEHNAAGLTAGALYKDGAGDFIVENTQFINNYAHSYGGAIFLLGDDTTDNYITNCEFINNVGYRGGALYAGGGNLTVNNSVFTGNKALRILEDYEDEEAVGGAFYNYYANVEFHNSNFTDNYAQDCGGAMELDNTVTSIGDYRNTTITIYFTGINNCNFINNSADDGGAISMGFAGTPFVLIKNSNFDSNTAEYGGAAISNTCGFLSIENSMFTNNTAVQGDDLIYVYGSDDLYNEYDAYLFIDNSTFKNNNVNLDIYVSNMYSFSEIYNSTFIGEQTVLSNRGFTNITSTTIKDSANASRYVINNFGSLGLENNTFDNPIFSDFYIYTPTYIVVLENKTYVVVRDSTFTLTALILDDNGNRIEGEDLQFIIGNKYIDATLKDHVYTASTTIYSGTNIVSANCSGTGLEDLSIKTATIIGKMPTPITVNVDDIYEGEKAMINVSLYSTSTGSVKIVVDGKTYNQTLVNGKASFVIADLKIGKYDVVVTYSGDSNFPGNSESATFNVLDGKSVNLEVEDLEKYYKGSERLVFKLTDRNGNPIVGENITVSLNGVPYIRTTNNEGIASIAINLNSGVYDVLVSYNGSANYNKALANVTVTVKPTVNGTDIVKVYRNGTQYYATFRDSQGNYLKEGTVVTFNINGVMYERKISGSEGLAKLNLNLEQGTYVLTAINPETGENAANNITIIARLIENRDITKYYRNGTQYTVKVIGDDGNPVGAGESVTFNINGVFYTRQTNASGIAKLNLNLQPGDYIITGEYGGCRVSNNIKVLPVLSASDMSMSYRDGSQFVAKLVDGQGKPLTNTAITFNINGVFYTRNTDGDGLAHLNINLMSGEYIITSSYNGANIANKITIH